MNAAAEAARRAVTVTNQRGLHARAAALFARTAGRFDAEVTVATGTHSVSALSIMGLLMLAATVGTKIDIQANGRDAAAAVAALAALVENGFEQEAASET